MLLAAGGVYGMAIPALACTLACRRSSALEGRIAPVTDAGGLAL
jgi:hypothetical protein